MKSSQRKAMFEKLKTYQTFAVRKSKSDPRDPRFGIGEFTTIRARNQVDVKNQLRKEGFVRIVHIRELSEKSDRAKRLRFIRKYAPRKYQDAKNKGLL